MSRQPKLTKWSIENALRRWRTVSEAARQLGLDRRTFQRSMKRLGVDRDAVTSRKATDQPNVAPAHTEQETARLVDPKRDPEPAPAPARPDARRLTATDFSGACLGESTRSDSRAGERRRAAG